MTLSFGKKFQDGTPTYFVDKIWQSLFVLDREKYYFGDQPLFLMGLKKELITDKSYYANPKVHTIRKDSKNRWKEGNKIHFVVNNRTKDRFQFAPVLEVKSVQGIHIIWSVPSLEKPSYPSVFVYDIPRIGVLRMELSENEIEKLAINDGFDSVEKFFEWFSEDFTGKIIHWTDLRY